MVSTKGEPRKATYDERQAATCREGFLNDLGKVNNYANEKQRLLNKIQQFTSYDQLKMLNDNVEYIYVLDDMLDKVSAMSKDIPGVQSLYDKLQHLNFERCQPPLSELQKEYDTIFIEQQKAKVRNDKQNTYNQVNDLLYGVYPRLDSDKIKQLQDEFQTLAINDTSTIRSIEHKFYRLCIQLASTPI